MENKPKHTPGPWVYARGVVAGEAVYIVAEHDRYDGTGLCTVHTGNPHKAGSYRGESARAAKANAALIAAAPDLLEALQRMVSHTKKYFDIGSVGGLEAQILADAEVAIAKATGGANG